MAVPEHQVQVKLYFVEHPERHSLSKGELVNISRTSSVPQQQGLCQGSSVVYSSLVHNTYHLQTREAGHIR